MFRLRWLALCVSLTLTSAARAQTVNLTEGPLVDVCTRNEIRFELKGKITVLQGETSRVFPHEATGTHVYLERVLDATGPLAERAARHYLTAEGVLAFNEKPEKRKLPASKGFLVAHRTGEQVLTYSPTQVLRREEMELTEHFDTMALPGLAPQKAVAVGDSWTVPNAVAAALCDFDGLVTQNLACKLERVTGEMATVSVVGQATGIDAGAQVKLLVKASYDFDLKENRIVALRWEQSDQRQQGPVSPALSADVVISVKRSVIAEPVELNKFALVPIPQGKTPPAGLTNLHYRDPHDRYELQHGREWHVVSEDPERLVLRMMERGDFVMQATVVPWKNTPPAAVMTLKAFSELMAKTPGWQEDTRIEEKEVQAPKLLKHYRLTASGQLDQLACWQSFNLLVSPEGKQVIVTFSWVEAQAANVRDRDLALLQQLQLLDSPSAIQQTSGESK